jgi:hypothetical protein
VAETTKGLLNMPFLGILNTEKKMREEMGGSPFPLI